MAAGALPLNVTPSATPYKPNHDFNKSKSSTPDSGTTPMAGTPPNGLPNAKSAPGAPIQNVTDISSPHELTAFVRQPSYSPCAMVLTCIPG